MKRLIIIMLTVLVVSLIVGIEANAQFSVNEPGKVEASSSENGFIQGERGFYKGVVVTLDASGKHGLESQTHDEPDSMTWDAAVTAVQKHGPGWRLPTIAELGLMYEHRKLIGGFSAEDYWSSTERDVNSAWIQGFRVGDQDRYVKHSKLKVRAVRSF